MFYNIKKQTDEKYGLKRKRDDDYGFQSAKQMLESRMKKVKPTDKSQSTLDTFFKSKSNENNEEKEEIYDNEEEVSSSTDNIIETVGLEGKHSPADKIEEETNLEPCNVPEISEFMKSHYTSNNIKVNEDEIHADRKIQKKDKSHHSNSKKELKEDKEKLSKELEKTSKKVKGDKQKIGQFIVQLLMPAYTQKKFSSKDAFKSVARKITHDVMNKELTGTVIFLFYETIYENSASKIACKS